MKFRYLYSITFLHKNIIITSIGHFLVHAMTMILPAILIVLEKLLDYVSSLFYSNIFQLIFFIQEGLVSIVI